MYFIHNSLKGKLFPESLNRFANMKLIYQFFEWCFLFLQKTRAQTLLPVTAAMIDKAEYNISEDIFRFDGIDIHQVRQ